ncbi:MAG: helix-turn-helix transcriptional regulator [Reichenbachiella sp.]|uniref:PadR family transcriptional regulator n=1 Tax=Reichenbachiella sp. TaxID=2184521 RepID=UPI003267247A
MKGTHLGEFEELVLLSTAVLDGNAYTVTIVNEIKEKSARQLTLSAIHTVLVRLEKKGYLLSYMGGATAERGGRRRRLYKITAQGYQQLNDVRELRSKMWAGMPRLSFDFSSFQLKF